MADILPPYDPARSRRTLFSALADARARFGRSRAIVVDGDERTLTYEELVRAALALGHALKAGTRKGENVGVLLPTGIGSVIAVLALSAYGRVPAMLNFTAGEQGLRTALKMAKITRVVTAHRFIELGKFETLEAWMKTAVKMVYLEEVREKLSLFDKITAAVGSLLPRQIAEHGLPADAMEVTDEALQLVITEYTREAGVRNLERQIGAIARKVAARIATKPSRCRSQIGHNALRSVSGSGSRSISPRV